MSKHPHNFSANGRVHSNERLVATVTELRDRMRRVLDEYSAPDRATFAAAASELYRNYKCFTNAPLERGDLALLFINQLNHITDPDDGVDELMLALVNYMGDKARPEAWHFARAHLVTRLSRSMEEYGNKRGWKTDDGAEPPNPTERGDAADKISDILGGYNIISAIHELSMAFVKIGRSYTDEDEHNDIQWKKYLLVVESVLGHYLTAHRDDQPCDSYGEAPHDLAAAKEERSYDA